MECEIKKDKSNTRQSLHRWSIQHVLWTGNRTAHALPRHAKKLDDMIVWLKEILGFFTPWFQGDIPTNIDSYQQRPNLSLLPKKKILNTKIQQQHSLWNVPKSIILKLEHNS